MKTTVKLLVSLLLSFSGLQAAQADDFVGPPVLEKIYINSDSMQAVLYWNSSHSSPDNAIYDYAATTDGKNFYALGVEYKKKHVTVLSLPTRIPRTTYIFAVAPILRNGLGPVSNVLTGEVVPYLIPIEIGKVTSLIDGFFFDIKDVEKPGYSSSYVQYFVSDIYGSSTAYVQSGSQSGRYEIRGVQKGEIATATVYKRVALCQGYSVALSCPYSSTAFVKGEPLRQLEAPRFGLIQSINDGFSTSITNFDSELSYTFEVTAGITATVDEKGLIEVHGMEASSSIKIQVNASHTGFAPASATLIGKSLDKAYSPNFSAPKRTNAGFIIQILNFDARFDHKLSTSSGTVSINSKGSITVTGLGPAMSANIKLEILDESKAVFETTLSGQALAKKTTAKR